MTLGKKIALMLSGIIILTVAAVGIYLSTSYNFALSEFGKTFKDYRNNRAESTAIVDKKPFSVLLMGVDTGKGSREEQWVGNSDSMLLVTVNPETKSTTVTSLERDILVDLADSNGELTGNQTKLNAAYAIDGAPMAIATVEQLLDIKIDHYMQLNMQGLVDLVNAVGGITVTNDFDFPIRIDEWEPEYTSTVEPGTHKVNGDQALVYARMRYDDPEGDYGRQRRQRLVIQKILAKLLSLDSVSNYNRILKAISKNMQTDILITSKTIPSLLAYRDVVKNLKSYQLQGQDAELDGGSYQAVTSEHLLETQNRIKTELGLPTSTVLKTSALVYEDLYGLAYGSVESQPVQSDEALAATAATSSAQTYYYSSEATVLPAETVTEVPTPATTYVPYSSTIESQPSTTVVTPEVSTTVVQPETTLTPQPSSAPTQ